MPLSNVIDAVNSYLGSVLDPAPALLGAALPGSALELPAVVLSVSDVRQALTGLGRQPVLSRKGALQVEPSVDLAQPALVFGDETVDLLSADRRTLQAPHSPWVRKDGTPPPLTAADIRVHLGATALTLVGTPPAAGQFRADPVRGQLTFGAPLPTSGRLSLLYFIGEWESRATRYEGVLAVDVFATSATNVDTLSRAVLQALQPDRACPIAGFGPLSSASYGVIAPSGVAGDGVARTRNMTFSFDYEYQEAVITTGGGPISDVSVDITVTGAAAPEHFDVVPLKH